MINKWNVIENINTKEIQIIEGVCLYEGITEEDAEEYIEKMKKWESQLKDYERSIGNELI